MADKTVAGLTSSTPTTDDLTISYDNADTSELKKTTWQAVRDLFKTYYDTLYQAILVSGTNIKTVNGNSLLGSGDLTISGGGSVATDTIWDAKGDLAVGTGANTASRLPVGLNGQILVADSAEATGVKWATASGSGDMLASTYDPANIAQQVVGTTATQTISGKTLTTPRFADLGFIADQNGNEMLAFNSNASAVNYLELENGTTTNPPHIRSKGDDTNIELHLVAKGTGLVSVCDSTDETKRIRFQASGNSTGVITTIASSDTTAHTITLPNATDTLVGRTTTDTLTNKTLTSPTLITPVLGTPSSGVATNLTGTATGLTSGITNALKSATTTVDVSAATAPSSGQVLTATSSTTATWQTPQSVFCGVLAIQTSTGTITDNSLDLINFDNELYDTDGFHNTSTNNGRLTVPSGKAGKYDVRGQIETNKTDATIFYTLAIYKNGVITHIKNQKLGQQTSNPTYQDSCAQISGFIDLAVGDYIELYVSQSNSGAGNSTTVAAGTWFGMTLMK